MLPPVDVRAMVQNRKLMAIVVTHILINLLLAIWTVTKINYLPAQDFTFAKRCEDLGGVSLNGSSKQLCPSIPYLQGYGVTHFNTIVIQSVHVKHLSAIFCKQTENTYRIGTGNLVICKVHQIYIIY